MLIGLVMYISIFKAEVGGKLRATSQLQPAVFTYKYGYSFILYVSGFVSTEISGTCAVFLYIYWHQKDWRKKGYDTRTKFVSPTNVFDFDSIYGTYPPFCKKHKTPFLPSYANGCSISDDIFEKFSPNLQRRVYLEGQNTYNDGENEFYPPFCLKHSASCNMVNELMGNKTEPKKQNRKVGTSDFSEIYPNFSSKHYNNKIKSSYSYEFVAKNYYPKLLGLNDEPEISDECSSSATHDHDFIPFDLDDKISVPPNYNNFDNFLLNNEYMYKTLSKTTPV